ncbi:MAG: hypothetical protein NVSMB2_28040 [Chloroflexota bacterium]
MIDTRPANVTALSEKDLRQQINVSVSRALFDGDYAAMLLADPTLVLEDGGCAPQHYKDLRSIRASDIPDFARQAYSVFWTSAAPSSTSEDQRQLAAAAR